MVLPVHFWVSPPVHMLLRDYARGVIERAIDAGVELGIDRRKIKPPYDAKWPRNIPSDAKLRPLGDWKQENPKIHPSQLALYSSVMGMGDFARYIIGTNSGTFDWQAVRLGRPQPPTAREIREQFLQSLSGTQRELWLVLEGAVCEAVLSQFQLPVNESDQRATLHRRRCERLLKKVRDKFIASLNAKQLRVYRRDILPRGLNGYRGSREHAFDLKLVQRFILNRVFELGWTAERFGDFDRDADAYSGHGRESHKAERMGKKYQWLAYHEALARIADNFVFLDKWPDKKKDYEGTWQTWRRDIDPSTTIKKTHRSGFRSSPSSWWVPIQYNDWRRIESDRDWLQESGDLPKIQRTLGVIDPNDASRWLTLQGYYHWDEPTPVDKEWSEIPHRGIWFHLRSYIVRKQDFSLVFDWAKQQNYMGRWMPESSDTTRLFQGELFWSPAFRGQWDWARGARAWTQDGRGAQHNIPKPLIVTAQEFLWEGHGYDCSIEDSIGMHIPCPWLAESLGLRWGGREARSPMPLGLS